MNKFRPSVDMREEPLPGGKWGPLFSFADETTTHGLKLISRGRGPIRILSLVMFCVFLAVTVRTIILGKHLVLVMRHAVLIVFGLR